MGNTKLCAFEGQWRGDLPDGDITQIKGQVRDVVLKVTHGTYAAVDIDESGYLGSNVKRPFVVGVVHSYSTIDLLEALRPLFKEGCGVVCNQDDGGISEAFWVDQDDV